MNRRVTTLVLAMGLAMGLMIPAGAADLHEPHTGMSFDCDGTVTLHFVNNQTDGAAAGDIWVSLNDGATTIQEGPDKVLRNVQHYYVNIDGDDVLSDAWTQLPGKLVLSDYDCHKKKK
jgi:hypothetical protein